MELIRNNSDKWNLYKDKIAVIGFSAGGHLAACAATMSKNRPNVAILGYAVAGEDVKGCNASAPSAIPAVDDNTCPCFLFATRTDNVVPIVNSLDFMRALDKYDIAFESHIYAYGPHGFSTADISVQSGDICSRTSDWVADSIGWLSDMFGDFSSEGMSEPRCSRAINGDRAAFLSIDCTMRLLLSNEQSATILKPMLEKMSSGDERGKDMDMTSMMRKMRLRDILAFGSVPDEIYKQINMQLAQIPNK